MGQGASLDPGQRPQPLRSHPPALQLSYQGCGSAPQPACRWGQCICTYTHEDDVCRCAAKFSISAEDCAAAAAEFRRRRRVLARLPQLGEEDSSFADTLDADPQREEQQEQLQQRKRARSAPVPAPAPAASGKRPAPPGDANKPPGKRAAPPPGEVIDLCDSD